MVNAINWPGCSGTSWSDDDRDAYMKGTYDSSNLIINGRVSVKKTGVMAVVSALKAAAMEGSAVNRLKEIARHANTVVSAMRTTKNTQQAKEAAEAQMNSIISYQTGDYSLKEREILETAMGSVADGIINVAQAEESKPDVTEESILYAISEAAKAVSEVCNGIGSLPDNTDAIIAEAEKVAKEHSDSDDSYMSIVQTEIAGFVVPENNIGETSLANRKVIATANTGSTQFMYDEWAIANRDDEEINQIVAQIKGKYDPAISDEKARIILWINLVLRRVWTAKSVAYTDGINNYFVPYEVFKGSEYGDYQANISSYLQNNPVDINKEANELSGDGGILHTFAENIDIGGANIGGVDVLNAANWYDAKIICNNAVFMRVLAECLKHAYAVIQNHQAP